MKLNAVEDYLRFYTTALKKMNYKLCYIDAFAGGGSVIIKDGTEVEGSALRAIRYPFDKFMFFDIDQQYLASLKLRIESTAPDAKVEYCFEDCNHFLSELDKTSWKKEGWRGVIFIDPYAMNLGWECLNTISKTEAFDIWYLFPFSAVTRNLFKNGKIPEANKKRLDFILGVKDWPQYIYYEDPQQNMFGDRGVRKIDTKGLKKYILNRLRSTFPTVSTEAALLKNERKSPLFLLCFAGSNTSSAAKSLSLKAADHILTHI